MGPPAAPACSCCCWGWRLRRETASSCLPGPGPIAALVMADIIMTLLIAGGAYWLAKRGQGAVVKPRPPRRIQPIRSCRGTRGDIYSDLKR